MLKSKYLPIVVALLTVINLTINAQVTVPVNYQTGQPGISIPIYTITNGDLAVPVSLNYTAGVRVATQEGNDEYNLGVGWSLAAVGKISRSVKSLPDDYQGTLGDNRVGWLYGNGASQVSNFTPQSRANCSQDAQNYYTLNSLATSKTDTEPDVFNFSFGGQSGQFVFDNNKVIQTLPYQDLDIQVSYLTDGSIGSFTVRANDGTKYIFAPVTTVTVSAVPTGADNTVFYMRDKLAKYTQPLTYTTEWGLTTITSVKGDNIYITYGGSKVNNGYTVNLESVTNNTDFKDIYLAGNTLGTVYKNSLYTIKTATTKKLIAGVSDGSDYSISFNYKGSPSYLYAFSGTDAPFQVPYYNSFIDNFQVVVRGSIIQTVNLTYAQSNKKFLRSVQTTNGCVKSPAYTFEYSGTDFSSGVSVLPASYTGGGASPVAQQCQADYWGYYNANGATTLVPNLYVYPNEPLQERYRLQQIPGYSGTYNYLGGGANRSPNPSAVSAGSLNRITFPTGGSATITYESNQYYDSKAGQTFPGGGIRVKSVTVHDGISAGNDMVKNYSYTGGVLVNRPQFALSLPVYRDASGSAHTIEQYNDQATRTELFTARSEDDLNPYSFDDPSVLYQSVTEQQSGKGYSTYQYLVPATNGQTFSPEYASPYQWQPTYSRYATTASQSTQACMSTGLMIDGYNGFPYATNPNYTFERGRLQSIKDYNEAGQLVMEKDYQYTPVYKASAPQLVYGLAFDYSIYDPSDPNNRAYQYGKYQLYAGTNKLISSEKIITFDPATNFSQSATVQTDNTYSAANHLLLSGTTNSLSNDGVNTTTYKTRFKYPQDYNNTNSPNDGMTFALFRLKMLFINSAVIEKTTTITKPNQAEQLLEAELHKFSAFTVNGGPVPLLSQTSILKANIPFALSGFSESSVNGNGQFTNDSRYRTLSTFSEYNAKGTLSAASDMQQNLSGSHYDFISGRYPLATFKNAMASQVVYSSFDNDRQNFTSYTSTSPANPYTFVLNSYPNISMVAGRNGEAISLPANYSFSKTGINKGIGQNYTFSCWVRSSNSGAIAINLSDAANHTASTSVSYGNTFGGWTYVKVNVPISSMNAAFNVQVVASTALAIDDMLFYPTMAQVFLSSYSYSDLLKTSTTDPHGNTTFYQYDSFRRPTLTLDNNRNILKRVSYNYNVNYQLSAYFQCPTAVNVGTAINLQTGNTDPCEPGGITRSWNFGDGTTATGTSAAHTYSTAGSYTVTLTVSSPQYGTVFSSQQITVFEQLSFDLSACGIVTYNTCTNTALAYGSFNAQGPCNMPVGTNTFTVSNIQHCSNNNDGMLWQMAYDNDPNNWISVSNSNNTATIDVRNPGGGVSPNKSYTLKCVLFPTNCTAQVSIKTYHIQFVAPTCAN
jgi:YD repeat-containing protein